LGTVSLVLGILFIFVISAWVSTQRGVGTVAGTFVDIPMIFGNYENALLFFIGVFCGSFAIFKGYRVVFGTVPGYKEMSEHYKSAVKLRDECLQLIRNEVQKPFDSAIGTYTSINFLIRETSQKLSEINSELKQVQQDFYLTKNSIQATLKVVIDTYRGTNAAVRPTGIGVPDFFSEEVLLDGDINEAIYVTKEQVEQIQQRLKTLSESIQEKVAEENTFFLEEKGQLLNNELKNLIENTMEQAKLDFLSHIANAKPIN
jgi:hypothetical protein